MNLLKHRYQYWWNTGEGYALQEFDNTYQLLSLIASYSSNNFYITERPKKLEGINFTEEKLWEDHLNRE